MDAVPGSEGFVCRRGARRHTTEPLEVERWMERTRMARVFSRSTRMSE